ncbi:MAG TPA: TonB family protein [Pyrinomonadaceae bacterium]|nr:TonB family protein [Pyrinomonadaceae bacterium]
MRKVFPLLIAIFLIQTTAAQSNTPAQPSSVFQAEVKKLTPEQTAELDEATRFSAKVVELYKEQKYDEALPLAKRVVEARYRILGEYNGLTASAKINLAELYMAKREYGQAENLYEQLLRVYERVFGVDHINNTIIIDSLALVNYLKRDYKKAEIFYVQSLSVREKALGSEHADVAEAAYKLAEFYRSRGAYAKAEPLFLHAIQISDKVFGVEKPEAQKFVQRYVCFLYESKSEQDAVHLEHKLWESRIPKSAILAGDIVNGKALSLPRPPYPEEARAIGASGVVRVQIKIDEEGKVIEANALCGHPLLAKPAEAAARRARFHPRSFMVCL